jgi:hypothetical protein
LRQQAKDGSAPKTEREIALFTLLYKQVTRGAYKDFLTDLALVPADAPKTVEEYAQVGYGVFPTGLFLGKGSHKDYPCPTLKESVAKLAANPKSANALVCLADFMRVNGFDQNPLDAKLDPDDLGGAPSQFAGPGFSRLDLYRGVIADPKTVANDKAYALYRAVQCYAPGGYNSCSGKEASKVQRKAWFLQLKRDYPNSKWAEISQYYW